jgi:ADP-heptose:LPS heptosyltransferase
MPSPLRILVIRRDNIGDLICTTPLLHGLRSHFPEARISVFASSYNVDVLNGNKDVDEIFIFLKRRQKSHGYGFFPMLWKRWKLVRTLRKQHFDYILLANGGWRYARHLKGKQTIGFRERDQPDSRQPDVILPLEENGIYEHEVSKLARLGTALGVPYEASAGPTDLFPDTTLVEQKQTSLLAVGWNPHQPTIGLHISSRVPERLWPEKKFVALAKKLIEHYGVQILLLWSPGLENNPMHPGDDAKAKRIINELQGLPVFPSPTTEIPDLIASTALLDQMICSDGGAMHVAAGLKKPVLAFFGPSNIEAWHPWQVPYVALRAPSKLVKDISLEEAFIGFIQLQTLKN